MGARIFTWECFNAYLVIAGFLSLFSTSFVEAAILITFDVDGTLIQGTGRAAAESVHAQAFRHALLEVLGDKSIIDNDQADTGKLVAPVADALPRRLYQGSTDGLILLRYARAALSIEPHEAFPQLDQMMSAMYDYVHAVENEAICEHLAPLPGVLKHLQTLATMKDQQQVMCGLVTGNVEGIARRKMEAVGVWGTGALAPPSPSQKQWPGTDHLAFLGGFGSDYCSGDIDDLDRNHLDRAEQIAIATKRCQEILSMAKDNKSLSRVVHVGDAPADVLAAKAFSERPDKDPDLVVGMVAVATGSYEADELRELAGEPRPGQWEPVVLEKGMADPEFLQACGIPSVDK